MRKKISVAKQSLRFTGIFEAELLVSLMLRNWNHPLAGDRAFENGLLESAAEVLRASVAGQKVIEDLSPDSMNFVAALWLAEATTLSADPEIPAKERRAREKWLETVRRAVPSCFCEPDLLI